MSVTNEQQELVGRMAAAGWLLKEITSTTGLRQSVVKYVLRVNHWTIVEPERPRSIQARAPNGQMRTYLNPRVLAKRYADRAEATRKRIAAKRKHPRLAPTASRGFE